MEISGHLKFLGEGTSYIHSRLYNVVYIKFISAQDPRCLIGLHFYLGARSNNNLAYKKARPFYYQIIFYEKNKVRMQVAFLSTHCLCFLVLLILTKYFPFDF